MVTIYRNYDEEPKDVFEPLPESLAATFYALEMDNFRADIDFFQTLLPKWGKLLELGCGSGRIADRLAAWPPGTGADRKIVGIDTSLQMLHLAKRRSLNSPISAQYLCMDMLQPAFAIKFDAILIAYNTLNLLVSENNILHCLNHCCNLLQPHGTLLIQLFIPGEELVRRRKTFQFQIFDRPEGGKLIKEIKKEYLPDCRSVQVEERFRVRPLPGTSARQDWQKSYSVAAFAAEHWLHLFNRAGFSPINIYGDYAGSPYRESSGSTLIAHLSLQ